MDLKVVALAVVVMHSFLGSADPIPRNKIAQLTETCKDDDLFPNPISCGSFYECAQGVLVEIPCPDGLHFNTVAGWCDYPELANCQLSTTEVPSTLAPTTELASTTEVSITAVPSTLAPTTVDLELTTCLTSATDVPSTLTPATEVSVEITELPSTTARPTSTNKPSTITSRPTTTTEEPTEEPITTTIDSETTTEEIGTTDYVELVTNSTIRPQWTTTRRTTENPGNYTTPDWPETNATSAIPWTTGVPSWPPTNTTVPSNRTELPDFTTTQAAPTTQRPVLRDNCQYEYTTKISSFQPYFGIHQLVGSNQNDTLNEVYEFKVLVRGEQDAKIILAHQNDQSEIIPEYEIVLGEDKNKRFSINRDGKYVSREKRDKLLNVSAWLPVIVRVHNDGLIELQIEGERNVFLSAKNKNHKRIDFVGFTNDGERTSDWLVGCPIITPAERLCTPHYSTEINETDFTTFIDIQNIAQNLPSSDIKLTVYVEATHDVIILLSSVDSYSVEFSAPSYEIRLATGKNQKEYELHRNHNRLEKDSANDLLQSQVLVPIDIVIKTGGSIEVLVAGSKGAKLKGKDPHPVNVRFLSFRSNVSTLTSQWYFDC